MTDRPENSRIGKSAILDRIVKLLTNPRSEMTENASQFRHLLDYLVEGHVDPKKTLITLENGNNISLLHVAALSQNPDFSSKKILSWYKQNPEFLHRALFLVDDSGNTPLHLSAEKEYDDDALFSAYAENEESLRRIFVVENNQGETPWEVAIRTMIESKGVKGSKLLYLLCKCPDAETLQRHIHHALFLQAVSLLWNPYEVLSDIAQQAKKLGCERTVLDSFFQFSAPLFDAFKSRFVLNVAPNQTPEQETVADYENQSEVLFRLDVVTKLLYQTARGVTLAEINGGTFHHLQQKFAAPLFTDLDSGEAVWEESFQSKGINLERELNGCQDFLDDVSLHFVLPFLYLEFPEIAQRVNFGSQLRFLTLQCLSQHNNAKDLLLMSHVWHQPGKLLPREIRDKAPSNEWFPLFEVHGQPYFDITSSSGETWRVRCLTSSEELDEEGQYLKHCVGSGSYDQSCTAGESHIVSIRKIVDGTEIPMSTIQYRQEKNELSIAQHRAANNKDPSNEEEELGQALLKRLGNSNTDSSSEGAPFAEIPLTRNYRVGDKFISSRTLEEANEIERKVGFTPSQEKLQAVFSHYRQKLRYKLPVERRSETIKLHSLFGIVEMVNQSSEDGPPVFTEKSLPDEVKLESVLTSLREIVLSGEFPITDR